MFGLQKMKQMNKTNQKKVKKQEDNSLKRQSMYENQKRDVIQILELSDKFKIIMSVLGI